eukprot:3661823-Rhodomonas_salina.1
MMWAHVQASRTLPAWSGQCAPGAPTLETPKLLREPQVASVPCLGFHYRDRMVDSMVWERGSGGAATPSGGTCIWT